MYSGVLKQVSHGDGHSLGPRGSEGEVSTLPTGFGEGEGANLESAACMSRSEPWENLVLKEHMLCLLHICHLCLFLGYGFAYSSG